MTSADLSDIRQSALGAADPLGVAAVLAEAVDSGGLADPDDAGYALTLAAEIAESRTKLDAALRYADRAVDAYKTRDDTQAGAAHALRARILFRSGRADEAMAELEPLRPLLTRYPDAAAYVTVALSVGGQNKLAEQWLTEAVQATLTERDQPADPASAEDAGQLFFLLQQRHRLRHALGLPHDTHDNLAERLETRLANAAAAGGPADDLLFWPQAEFDRLLAKWPALTESYDKNWDDHRARLERELVRLTGTGRVGLAVFPGTVDGLAGDATDAKVRAAYARQQETGTNRISWPPERNAACWCGSGNKYKKCCLPRSRG
ncbi:tetratricopeptide (TPR) repeat protein [Actinoplanes tereljensis]|uniref:Preprotein translocase SecA n=1 Tax=Paractinoplanes tereljensis TaxID=571912 RepID=A0A919NHD8_9ACTN|nr:SEC-C domain-containing protein [Actinoplanes tereljensis]GIF18223.1 preprotein translocase SecA [Actinoplanes tereljensis]